MSSKRELIVQAIDASLQAWDLPTPEGKEKVAMVILHVDHAKALVDASYRCRLRKLAGW